MSARIACTSCYLIIFVTDYSLTIHVGNTLDMIWLSATISESTEEIYYDQIAR